MPVSTATRAAVRAGAEGSWEQVAKLATNRAILDVSAAFEKEPWKVVWILVDYEREPSVTVRHYMDPDVALVLCEAIVLGTFPKDFPRGFTEYKGTPRPDGPPEARVLSIWYDPQKQYRYGLKIERGVGEIIGAGAVKMVERQEAVSFSATEFDMRRLAVQLRDYIRDAVLIKRLSRRFTVL